ncbi:hypothetical protein [Lacipirellula sp.]|uniref:hypothetical protein n=1 Tax=Lacipirellula sp. TaxID=2691419 RepID=UPI003D0B4639
MKNLLFQISNHHVKGGAPFTITSDQPLRYRGYFENSLGRQWVLAVDLSGEVKLRSGDIDWSQEIIVSNVDETVRDESLQLDEELWLRSCWAALFPEWKRRD